MKMRHNNKNANSVPIKILKRPMPQPTILPKPQLSPENSEMTLDPSTGLLSEPSESPACKKIKLMPKDSSNQENESNQIESQNQTIKPVSPPPLLELNPGTVDDIEDPLAI